LLLLRTSQLATTINNGTRAMNAWPANVMDLRAFG
jgi:hypothetical protein